MRQLTSFFEEQKRWEWLFFLMIIDMEMCDKEEQYFVLSLFILDEW